MALPISRTPGRKFSSRCPCPYQYSVGLGHTNAFRVKSPDLESPDWLKRAAKRRDWLKRAVKRESPKNRVGVALDIMPGFIHNPRHGNKLPGSSPGLGKKKTGLEFCAKKSAAMMFTRRRRWKQQRLTLNKE